MDVVRHDHIGPQGDVESLTRLLESVDHPPADAVPGEQRHTCAGVDDPEERAGQEQQRRRGGGRLGANDLLDAGPGLGAGT